MKDKEKHNFINGLCIGLLFGMIFGILWGYFLL